MNIPYDTDAHCGLLLSQSTQVLLPGSERRRASTALSKQSDILDSDVSFFDDSETQIVRGGSNGLLILKKRTCTTTR